MAFPQRRRFVSVVGRKSGVPEGLWVKCPACKQVVYRADVRDNQEVCPHCNYHYRVPVWQRIEWLLDANTFEETHANLISADPLGFTIEQVSYSYAEKIAEYQDKTGLKEAIVTGFGCIEGERAAFSFMDFSFAGASMGSVVGEKFCRVADDAIRERVPLVSFAASGGARMQEGTLGLMQMAKTADAVRAINEAAVPYISVLTNPTTGGVYASFASLADIVLAEPGAEIGFAGKRLIEGALKVTIPEGFQTSEYQFANGFVDLIVSRPETRSLLGKLLRYLKPQ
jgi:acetyl-CoA carboxylase carboxyl transferase subunit beta